MSNSKTPLADRFGPDAADVEFGGDARPSSGQLATRGLGTKIPGPIRPYLTLRRLCAGALRPDQERSAAARHLIIDAPSLKSEIGARCWQTDRWARNGLQRPDPSHLLRQQSAAASNHTLRDRHFANDHLDAFFNAAVDAAIALSAFVIAAEAEGLGRLSVSAVRIHSDRAVDGS
jgi:nitroreductase/FMN reductase [NAD(P)H]